MEYIVFTIAVITISTLLFYIVMNRLLRIQISIKPLILCALCAIFLILILPRYIIDFTGVVGSLALLTAFAFLFAYFIALYDNRHRVMLMAAATSSDGQFSIPVALHTEEAKSGMEPISFWDSITKDEKCAEKVLDYAYQQKEFKNYEEALRAFKHVLEAKPEGPDAPFVVIEIGSLLKMRGAYDEAIQSFVDAKSLASLQEDPFLKQEFINTIAYLRIIKNVLLYRGLGLLPFSNIPDDVLLEIEREYGEWRSLD